MAKVYKDFLEMISLAESGDPVAQFDMAEDMGHCGHEDEQLVWHQKSATQGYAPALHWVAEYKLDEAFWEFDEERSGELREEAKRLNYRAVRKDYAPAICALAKSYERGDGYVDRQDMQLAVSYSRKAAEAG